MKFEIKNRYSGEVIIEVKAVSLKAALEIAVKKDADLSGADLSRAYLSGADLRGANLRDVKNIPQSYINICSRDMLFIFEHLKHELPALRKALLDGKIDGTQYEGECCCLIGTLGKIDGGIDKVCSAISYYEEGLHNPGEQWFFQIREKDTPENSFFAKHALELIDAVLEKDVEKMR